MPVSLKKLSPTELKRHRVPEIAKLAKPRIVKDKFPARRLRDKAAVRAALKRWKKAQAAIPPPKPTKVNFKAVKFATQDVTKLRKVFESKVPHAEAVKQKFLPKDLVGQLFSVLATYQYSKMKAEYKRNLRRATTPIKKRAVEKQWDGHVKAAQSMFAKAGLPRLNAADLDRLASNLSRSPKNLDMVKTMVETAKQIGRAEEGALRLRPYGEMEATKEVLELPNDTLNTLVNFCDFEITGSYTKSIHKSISWNIRLTVWCPTWRKPWRTCKKTFTIAGASFTLGLDVGYRVNCYGISAWGCAYAQACATILGISVCASCQGCVVGAAAVGHSTGAGMCEYGFGLRAEVRCKFAGITIFYLSVPLGLVVNAPCPGSLLATTTRAIIR